MKERDLDRQQKIGEKAVEVKRKAYKKAEEDLRSIREDFDEADLGVTSSEVILYFLLIYI